MYEYIKDRLKEIGKMQKELAEFLNIAPSHLSAIFKGLRKIQSSEIPLMAQFLNVNLEDFVKYVAGQNSELKPRTLVTTHLQSGLCSGRKIQRGLPSCRKANGKQSPTRLMITIKAAAYLP